MIIPIDARYRGSVLAEQEMSRFADEFFNHWQTSVHICG